MAKDIAIVLNNGSIASAVATALAAQRFRLVLQHVEMGAGPQARARAAYDQQVGHFRPYREHTIAMPFLGAIQEPHARAALSSDPRAQVTQMSPQLRDLLPLIATAFRYAAHYEAAAVYLGLRVGGTGDELATATEFGQIWNELVQMPCGLRDLELITPLLELEPWQVIDVGFHVNAPFDKTWSCMEDGPEPCWACPGCRARERSFQQAGKIDPVRIVNRKP